MKIFKICLLHNHVLGIKLKFYITFKFDIAKCFTSYYDLKKKKSLDLLVNPAYAQMYLSHSFP